MLTVKENWKSCSWFSETLFKMTVIGTSVLVPAKIYTNIDYRLFLITPISLENMLIVSNIEIWFFFCLCKFYIYYLYYSLEEQFFIELKFFPASKSFAESISEKKKKENWIILNLAILLVSCFFFVSVSLLFSITEPIYKKNKKMRNLWCTV